MSGFVPSAFFPVNGGGGLPVPELDAPTAPSAGDYVIGGYHDLDGTDERIDFGLIPELEFDASDTFTISFWAYKDTAVSGSIVLSYDYGTTTVSTGEGWFINWTSSTLSIITRDLGSVYIRGINQPGINTWHHVVFVFAAGSFSAFLNGVSASITNISGTLFDNIDYTNVTDARIGNIQTGSLPFPGYIAEVAIWGSDQSANIAAIYNSRARHDLMDLATPPDVFYAPLTSYDDNPDGTADGVFEAVSGNDGTGVNMETADAVGLPPTTVTSTLTKALDIATSVVTTTKVENVPSGGGGTGSSFP